MKCVAIIPARGGSKRIPRKNIKIFYGKPIIAYSIQAALRSELFDRVIVSTDDAEIASIAKSYGAEVPFLRPKELSDDYTGTNDVVKHCLQWLIQHNYTVEYACCIYATAPFIQPDLLQKGFKILIESKKVFVFSVTSFPFPIQRAIRITEEGAVQPLYPKSISSRSQDLEKAYHDAGQFYWGTLQAFINDQDIYAGISGPIIIPRQFVQDIDTLEDWETAESLYKALQLTED